MTWSFTNNKEQFILITTKYTYYKIFTHIQCYLIHAGSYIFQMSLHNNTNNNNNNSSAYFCATDASS